MSIRFWFHSTFKLTNTVFTRIKNTKYKFLFTYYKLNTLKLILLKYNHELRVLDNQIQIYYIVFFLLHLLQLKYIFIVLIKYLKISWYNIINPFKLEAVLSKELKYFNIQSVVFWSDIRSEYDLKYKNAFSS